MNSEVYPSLLRGWHTSCNHSEDHAAGEGKGRGNCTQKQRYDMVPVLRPVQSAHVVGNIWMGLPSTSYVPLTRSTRKLSSLLLIPHTCTHRHKKAGYDGIKTPLHHRKGARTKVHESE